ncbi:hypothetical protein R3P38DRAFT_2434873, partial [Favolaschia claudopus]
LTQSAQLLEDFEEKFKDLGDLILAYEADPGCGLPCACEREGHIASVQCHDCTSYRLSCAECFITTHINPPFHWAEVWDFEQEFFVRHNISALGHTIQLGHHGGACETPVGE